MTPAEMRETAAVMVADRPVRRMTWEEAVEARQELADAIRALPLAEEAPPSLAAVLSALPHLTGDELRRVAEATPRVAGYLRHDVAEAIADRDRLRALLAAYGRAVEESGLRVTALTRGGRPVLHPAIEAIQAEAAKWREWVPTEEKRS